MIEPPLIERNDGFDYDLWMACSCGLSSPLSPSAYVSGSRQSRMACSHCGKVIHYGPAVAAIRDPEDPALDNHALNTFAWYHTSTQPDWPSVNFALDFVQAIDDSAFLVPSREAFIAEHTSKALHVGTYEAAIENMLRRMNDELDAHSQFYLYRVALRLDPERINAGFRDENHEIASDISTHELDLLDLSAVRYLNVHEAIGSLSLAVAPQAIHAVQRIALPLRELALPASQSDNKLVQDVRYPARRMRATASELRVAPMERRKMELGMLPTLAGAAKRHSEARRS